MSLDSIVNTRLFTVSNITAIGAIILFWSLASYAINYSVNGPSSQ